MAVAIRRITKQQATVLINLMHEADKLAEAEYFFRQMIASGGDRLAHKYNFSGFLTSARSVLQFALEEAKQKRGGKGWYDSQVQNKPVVQFFKDRRDVNVHAEPVIPNQEIAIQLSFAVNMSIGASATLIRDGNIVPEYPREEGPRRKRCHSRLCSHPKTK